jgi:hypothetical protein
VNGKTTVGSQVFPNFTSEDARFVRGLVEPFSIETAGIVAMNADAHLGLMREVRIPSRPIPAACILRYGLSYPRNILRKALNPQREQAGLTDQI